MTTTTMPMGDKKVLRGALWTVQVMLALAFGMAGVMKSTQPIDALAAAMVWPGAVPAWMVRLIGVSELAGAIGLVLPSLTRIQPRLTALAAMGLVLVMTLAIVFHLTRGELFALPINLTLGGLAAFVAWGRWKAAPIAPRS